MIPSANNVPFTALEIGDEPSESYKLDMELNVISGSVDELDAVRQAVYKILNTERYLYPVYSWDYGVELDGLLGEPADYVCAELERRVTEALTQDDRIEAVDGFEFDLSEKRTVKASFCVHSIYGSFEESKEVNI